MAGFRDKTDGTKASLAVRVKDLERQVETLEAFKLTLLHHMKGALKAHAEIEEIALERRHSLLLKMMLGAGETHVTKRAFQEICICGAEFSREWRRIQGMGESGKRGEESAEPKPQIKVVK